MHQIISVVVTYNRKELLLECLNALLHQTYSDQRILIVDNHSTDGTKDAISSFIDNKKVFYHDTMENKGGSYGFYLGCKLAVKMGCDEIWLMDDDCIPTETALESLVLSADKKNNDFGYLSSKVLWKDGSMCQMNIPKKDIGRHISNYDSDQKICIASFVSLFIRSAVIEEVGLPMKDFFIWGDDWEYTLRISKKHTSYFVPESVVTHKSKTNFGVNIAKAEESMLPRYQYAYRNECYFYRQGGFYGRLYLFIKIWLHTFRVLFSKCNRKATRLKYIYKYTWKGFFFHPHIDFEFNHESELNILEFFGDDISYGGQEMFMINLYRNIKNPNHHFTFATPFSFTNKELPVLLQQRNDSSVALNFRNSKLTKKKNICKGLRKILKSKKYDIIHIHSGSIYTLLYASKIAKKLHVKKIIVHSHLGGEMNVLYRLIKHKSDKTIDKYASIYLACSEVAAKWKFPDKILNTHNYIVLKNGIDIQKYTFDNDRRIRIRKELGLTDSFTMIHVGRFAKEKNHEFFLSILPAIKEKIPDFRFICIGSGDDKEKFQENASSIDLLNHFIFLENINNVNDYLFASDCFLLPSLHEGFPIALIEAEATGIPCIYSFLVTSEALLTDRVIQLSLEEKDKWIKEILEIHDCKCFSRESYAGIIKKHGFDSLESARQLEKIYNDR